MSPKESQGNMFNSIFRENVQGRKHPGTCAFAEPELLSYINDTQHQYSAHPKLVLETVMGCSWPMHKVTWYQYPYYRDSWAIQLKCIFETKPERIAVRYHPTNYHGHTNFKYICLLETAYFNHLECSYDIWYVYYIWSIRARTKVVRRKHIIQPTGWKHTIHPTGFGAYSSTYF